MAPNPTIFALSSGRPPAAIAVIRVRGPQAGVALQALTGCLPDPRQAALARVRDLNRRADRRGAGAVVSGAAQRDRRRHGRTAGARWPRGHRGRARRAGRMEGLRPAEPGEFTRRAFEHGRLDLTRSRVWRT